MLLADRPTTSRWTPPTGRTLLSGQADPRRQEPRPTLRPEDTLAGVRSHSEPDLGSAFDPTRTVARAGNHDSTPGSHPSRWRRAGSDRGATAARELSRSGRGESAGSNCGRLAAGALVAEFVRLEQCGDGRRDCCSVTDGAVRQPGPAGCCWSSRAAQLSPPTATSALTRRAACWRPAHRTPSKRTVAWTPPAASPELSASAGRRLRRTADPRRGRSGRRAARRLRGKRG